MFYASPVVVAHVAADLGEVWLAAASDGVAAVELLGSADGLAAGLARRGYRVASAADAPAAADLAARAAGAVAEILAGGAPDTSALALRIDDRPAWDQLVLGAVRAIPRGSTASYGEIAARIGRRGAARAVGGAVGRNPVSLLIPCHRVIAAGGLIGGYGAAAWGGIEAALDLKAELLRLEGVTVRR